MKGENEMKRKSYKKILAVCFSVLLIALTALTAFAADDTAGAAVTAVGTLIDTVKGTLNIANIVSLLSLAVGAALALVLMWFGVRKLIRVIMGAFKKGRLSV